MYSRSSYQGMINNEWGLDILYINLLTFTSPNDQNKLQLIKVGYTNRDPFQRGQELCSEIKNLNIQLPYSYQLDMEIIPFLIPHSLVERKIHSYLRSHYSKFLIHHSSGVATEYYYYSLPLLKIINQLRYQFSQEINDQRKNNIEQLQLMSQASQDTLSQHITHQGMSVQTHKIIFHNPN